MEKRNTTKTVIKIPPVFRGLLQEKLISADSVLHTDDGFFMLRDSLCTILGQRGIQHFTDREGNVCECQYFFDDWFLFAVSEGDSVVYSLLKMREQEHDRQLGILSDADTPGVTVCFVAMEPNILLNCLKDPSEENRKHLGMEINRVVAYRNQSHHPALKAYFIRPQSQAPYLIARTYVRYIATFHKDGVLEVPGSYRDIYRKRGASAKYSRVPDFLDQNNRAAGEGICDHEKIYIRDPEHLTPYEQLAILATHTGNVSLHSFAAEVRFHAMFLTKLVKIRLPLVGSAYASAIRADMSIADKEFQGPAPYYQLSGRLVRAQAEAHRDENDWQ
ncbi:MAG: hypothetical protein J6V25_13425 [Oscillospiraceae bacterium]|nr:hypothetical protein [Oscillospiraceae bacterium]